MQGIIFIKISWKLFVVDVVEETKNSDIGNAEDPGVNDRTEVEEPKKLFDYVKYYLEAGAVFAVGYKLNLNGTAFDTNYVFGLIVILVSFYLFYRNTRYGYSLIVSVAKHWWTRFVYILFALIYVMLVLIAFYHIYDVHRRGSLSADEADIQGNHYAALFQSYLDSSTTTEERASIVESLRTEFSIRDTDILSEINASLEKINESYRKAESVLTQTDESERIDSVNQALEDIGHIYFDNNSTEIDASNIETLNKIAFLLQDQNDLTLEVQGFSSHDGSFESNIDLGYRRAMAVRQYLTDNGVNLGRLVMTSYGELQQPKAQTKLMRVVKFSVSAPYRE